MVANVIVGGASYGQGSSREHAAICPMYLGVKAVIAKSFERIHSTNLVNFGILPLVFIDENDYDQIDQDDVLEILDVEQALNGNAPVQVKLSNKEILFKVTLNASDKQREVLKAGGMLKYVSTNA